MSLRRKISKDEVSQTFNLKTLLGKSPSVEQQELFYNLCVDEMVERTLSNEDVNGRAFKDYSPDYAKAKGVPVNSVDLALSGDMLNGIEDATESTDHVKIEIANDQVGKAYGHLSGMKGHKTIKRGKKRDFFGFKNKDDLENILSQVKQIAPIEETNRPQNVSSEEFSFIEEFNEQSFQETKVQKPNLAELREAIRAIGLDFGDLS
tara:strand:- start:20476 stop:21093 length:618 start_codon:yes stop_codon:yes gene_type:complete